MIRFDHVTKRLAGTLILDDISFQVEPRETLVIVGASGAGKSVTLRHMVRFLTPDAGKVWIGEACVSEANDGELEEIRRRFGYLFQGSALLQWLTVGDNVALPLREVDRLNEDEILNRVKETLSMVRMDGTLEKYPSELSGGMQKRVALARAIVTNPDIILYDEPTSGLDPVTSRTIDHLIDNLRAELGVTGVVVTHDLHSALEIGSRIAMLHEGKIIELSAPEAFARSANVHVRQFLEAQHINCPGSWQGVSEA
jgi:phospholipid/cholesterol/gamma-HCH transport system ATP-binding protein